MPNPLTDLSSSELSHKKPTSPHDHQYFKLFKPYGCLSQFVQEAKRRKQVLGDLYPFPANTMAVGRLDHDSEGLLLLTTDGMYSYNICGKHVEKEYVAQLDGTIDQEALTALQTGVEIGIKGEKYLTRPCHVQKLNTEPELPPRGRNIRDARHGPISWIKICISEGKNRQIRKMTAAVGFPTLRLIRIRVGTIHLGKLMPAEVENITDAVNNSKKAINR
ncbi:pseudouridine synthase [Shewanella surugensis]|uniref:Pseudouridine synthase n=1 Tax=Shewanella surugensis TaxID=212020 RepID=A0ABT0LB96_9GAMM|nr:pseudouridine synthase [Shewanella surugensis]MCL1124446.1 pseudouridine synthase [Shewanella surugensis]